MRREKRRKPVSANCVPMAITINLMNRVAVFCAKGRLAGNTLGDAKKPDRKH